MKYLVFSFILIFYTLQTFAQQEYFIYLQTDNSQAFYVRANKNVYSSTSSGYLILLKNADSASNITIGFPKNVFPEQQFNISASHKDAGYVLKSFGEKGWGLLNLQTEAVIMNSNPPEEKKSPEITGVKKTDDFSLLLASAVNDTAVLYSVTKPKKIIVLPAAIAAEEKKKDSVSIAKEIMPRKDSNALVKNTPVKNDSAVIAKSTAKTHKDTTAATTHLPPEKGKVNVGMSATLKRDAGSTAKNTVAPVPVSAVGKNTISKNNPPATGKNISKPRKDTIIIAGAPAAPETTNIAKNKERKDTIIMMSSGKESNKSVAKTTAIPQINKPLNDTKKDSLPFVKNETTLKAEEKATVLPNNSPPVIVENTPVKKDTNAALVKNETIKPQETKPDTVVTAPAKRLKPLVNKAAELLTDTSYVAVFVDESKDKFDTIRISIPFDEYTARMNLQKAAAEVRPADTTSSKTTNNNTQVIVTGLPATTSVIKKDSIIPDKIIKDTVQAVSLHPSVTAAAKKDSAAPGKTINDSTALMLQPAPAPAPVKKDSNITDTAKENIAANMQPAVSVTKKDSTPVTLIDTNKDSAAAKKPAQPLYLNSDCKENAFDIDIDKLRIKMLLVTSDEDRITLAKKVYKQKCFSVKQVRALSELFKTDEGKYKWFDAVYPFVSDTGNFSSLGELIKNDYYLNRFKAMLRN